MIQIKDYGLKRVVMLCASVSIKNIAKMSKNFHSNEINQDQYVIINSFRLDHIRPQLYIQQFRQKLFYALPVPELIEVSRAMLDSSHIKLNKKEMLQVYSKCVEEV